ncbi:Maf family protein [Alkaliphilus serpentinus]|uniref:dTTP/UTP pyrophosphatase n=1 Tax=Alkaliphilus serpentinus TaxID=1482731 RepID=A0A833MEK2_9FIRM|nr:Maf family protein [Alkaliphilus serpentinus]KAB3531444.1 septum formation protein Maf [Alkaliphilus serpentinus]
MLQLILASKSPRRRELLSNLGVPIKTMVSNINEEEIKNPNPVKLAQEIAYRKALKVKEDLDEDGIIIAADTVVYCNGFLAKPKDKEDAYNMITILSGKKHQVITGFAIISTANGKEVLDSETTNVYFKKLSPEEIARYVATGEPMDKAGGYGIQGYGSLLVERIEGDYFNVVGLPLFKLNNRMEKDFKISLLPRISG